ncbi:MAG TPA: hypothetical protein VF472_14810 [Burkholderiaceae bacterium]
MNSNRIPFASLLRTTVLAIVIVTAASWGGYALCDYVPVELLAGLLKYGISVVGVIWFFSLTVYNKLSDISDISGLDYDQHRRIEIEVRSRLQWFWLRAVVLGMSALVMFLPSLILDLKAPKMQVPSIIVAIGCGCFAICLVSLRGVWRELEDIRQLRSYVKEIERREKERADQVKELKEGSEEEWKPDETLKGFREAKNSGDFDDEG